MACALKNKAFWCHAVFNQKSVGWAIVNAYKSCLKFANNKNKSGRNCRLFMLGDLVVWRTSPSKIIKFSQAYANSRAGGHVEHRNLAKDITVGFVPVPEGLTYKKYASSHKIDYVKVAKKGGHFLSWSKEEGKQSVRLWTINGDQAQNIAKLVAPKSLHILGTIAASISSDGKFVFIGTRSAGSVPRILRYNVQNSANLFIEHPKYKNTFPITYGGFCGIDKHPSKNQMAICWLGYTDSAKSESASEVWLQDIATGKAVTGAGGLNKSGQITKEGPLQTSTLVFSPAGNFVTTFSKKKATPKIKLKFKREFHSTTSAQSKVYSSLENAQFINYMGGDIVLTCCADFRTMKLSGSGEEQTRFSKKGLEAKKPVGFAVASPDQFAFMIPAGVSLFHARTPNPVQTLPQTGLLKIAWNPGRSKYIGISAKQIHFYDPIPGDKIASLNQQSSVSASFKKNISEVKKLFTNGFTEEAAELFTSLSMIESSRKFWPHLFLWYSTSLNQSDPELLRYFGEMLLYQSRNIQKNNGGKIDTYSNARLLDYGIVASMAGHSGISEQVVRRLRKASSMSQDVKIAKRINQYALVLSGLVAADQGNYRLAYKNLLKADIKDDKFLVRLRISRSTLFGSLFKNRKKLSFVTGIAEAKLEHPNGQSPAPSKFLALNGKYVKSIRKARVSSGGKTGKQQPTRKGGSKKKKKARVLD